MEVDFNNYMGLTTNKRFEVRERAKNKSELSGTKGRPLQCCHLDHQRNQYYNGEDVVVLVTDIEHYAYHLIFKNQPLEIGLHKGHNGWAIKTLKENIMAVNRNIGMTDEQFEKAVDKAMGFWFYYLGIEET